MKLMTSQEAIRILNEQRNKFMDEWVDFGGVNEAYNMAINLLKEQEKLIDADKLREKLGFAKNCEQCKQNARYCQYDSHFSLMDFCERLEMAIEELTKEGR